jgi:amino acid adenylation domain-containing protein
MSLNPPSMPPIQPRRQPQAPLSFSQESLWFLQQLDARNNAYNVSHLFKFTGGIEHIALEKALNALAARHETLRTLYPSREGKPEQVIQPAAPFPLPRVDLSGLTGDEQQTALHQYIAEHGNRPYDLQHGPLVRCALLHTAPGEDHLFFGTHHIGFDAWSRQVFASELLQLYDAIQHGSESHLHPLQVQFADYALWQREWLSGEVLERFVAHWKEILSGELPTLDLPVDRPRPAMQTYQGARHYFDIPVDLSARIKEVCQKERITPFHFFLAAYAILLRRYSGQKDLVIGCPFANRPLPGLDGIIGAFINTLPIRINLENVPSVHALLAQVRTVMLDAMNWQAIPFETLVSELSPQRDLSRTPIFQVLINMRNVPRRLAVAEGLKVESVLMDDATAAFDLSLELGNETDHFSAALRYNVNLFDQSSIQKMAGHYQNLLLAMLDDADRSIPALEMLSASERQQILEDWNDTHVELPQRSIASLIAEQATKTPRASAVLCDGRQLTYADLELRTNQLASYLISKGVRPGMMVGILLPRTEDLLVTQLAILKAGGACVPFDLTYPAGRLGYMLRDSAPALVVTHSTFAAQVPDDIKKVYLDTEAGAIINVTSRLNLPVTGPEALVYVTYTSGSTGRPKGVMSQQRGVLNYLDHLVRAFHLHAGERVIQFTPLSFDAAFRDTLGALTFGGTVFLMDDEQMRDPEVINKVILDEKITCILSVVPTMLRALARSMAAHKKHTNSLRYIMPSGEALLPAEVELVRNAYGSNVQIVNQYGPTECSMITTLYPIPGELPAGTAGIPIGRPISNARAYVLDEDQQPVPVGVKGELYIGGIGVGLGYLKQPALTAERFLPDPFNPDGRMYRTGDLVFHLPDGTLVYQGRLDHQVKVRGYRVELGEIEAVIGEFHCVKEAAVVLYKQEDNEQICAYVTVESGCDPFSVDDLRWYLTDRLPFYMLPSTITVLDEMPLSPNRKIDRRALPVPTSGAARDDHLAPRNEVETKLAAIWKELLGVERVGVKDNFFSLGGHSLMAVQLFARIEQQFNRSLPLLLIFKDGTVEALAAALAGQSEHATPYQVVPIQPEGNGTPLFILSAGGFYMRDLAQALGKSRPVFGLMPFEEGQLVYRGSVQETAEIFYQCLVEFRPQGPYMLLSHSANGYFAIEVARLLRGQGKEVAFLGLLDPYPPGARRQAKAVDRVRVHLDNLQQTSRQEAAAYIRRALSRLVTRLWHAVGGKKVVTRYQQRGQIEELRRYLLRSYRPQPYDGDTFLFAASDRPWYVRWDPMEGWEHILSGHFERLPVPGSHFSMIEPPQAAALAEKISGVLDEHEARQG